MAGSRFDTTYPMSGALPGGAYNVQVQGFGQGSGSVMVAELGILDDAGAISVLDTESYTLVSDAGYVSGTLVNANPTLPEDAGGLGCGNTLVVRLSMPFGPDSGYFSVVPQLTVP